MPLRPAVPSHLHTEQVRLNLQHMAGQPTRQLNALADAAPGELGIDTPYQVFIVGLDQVIGDTGLRSAVPTGWRYLLRQGDQVVAAAQTVTDDGGQAAFASFNSGPYVESTRLAFGTAEEYAGAGPGSEDDWEPRILHVPALHAMALWLHTEAETTDIVLPLPPAPRASSPIGAAPCRITSPPCERWPVPWNWRRTETPRAAEDRAKSDLGHDRRSQVAGCAIRPDDRLAKSDVTGTVHDRP
ncbi:MAG: hypothetical protein H0V49_09610 [Nocardioidaceae bacterium]|nr:hypothetical protein [Nocardioidaceae bacterium]